MIAFRYASIFPSISWCVGMPSFQTNLHVGWNEFVLVGRIVNGDWRRAAAKDDPNQPEKLDWLRFRNPILFRFFRMLVLLSPKKTQFFLHSFIPKLEESNDSRQEGRESNWLRGLRRFGNKKMKQRPIKKVSFEQQSQNKRKNKPASNKETEPAKGKEGKYFTPTFVQLKLTK